jgi:hypothetical protein
MHTCVSITMQLIGVINGTKELRIAGSSLVSCSSKYLGEDKYESISS